MKLVFLYGPPAVGKLTVAKVLAQKTGYKLLHNHLLVNPIAEVIPFENPANRVLTREFRLRIIEEAIKSNINVITTFGITGNDPFSHITDIINMVASNGGVIYLVQMTADKETILNRVEGQSRQIHGKNLSKEKLKEILQNVSGLFDTYEEKEHVTVDTTAASPKETAAKIIAYYKL